MKNLLCGVVFLLGLSVVRAAEAPPARRAQGRPAPAPGTAAAPTRPRPQEPELDYGTMIRLIRQMDADGDLLVDEKELNGALRKLQQDTAAVRTDLLAWLDKDRNGTLSQPELRPLFAVMAIFQFVRAVDQNGDLNLDDAEMERAFARFAEACQQANDRLLGQFDRDGDGQLNEAEMRFARQGFGMGPPPAGGPRGGPRGNPPAAAAGRGKAP